MLPELRLKVRAHGRHPHFYRKMVRKPEETIAAGSAVHVVDREGSYVGVGFYNPRTELALRMLSRERLPDDDVERELVRRLGVAIDLRETVLGLPRVTDGYRLVHAEGDGVPGVILDRLGDVVVGQIFALCAQIHLEALGEHLRKRNPDIRLVSTVDATARKREGLDSLPPSRGIDTTVTEHGVRFAVRAGAGHKTGFFADQRDNRQLIRSLSRGRRVLDLCCNAGGFAINAARGGAKSVRAVDLDEAAVEQAAHNAAENDVRIEVVHADAFDELREIRPGQFDLFVLDPPKWAQGKSDVDAALARYRDLNRLALEKAEPGSFLLTCSCSGAVHEERFLAALRDAAVGARRDVRILGQRGAGPDHPVALECLETRYLKAVLLEVRG